VPNVIGAGVFHVTMGVALSITKSDEVVAYVRYAVAGCVAVTAAGYVPAFIPAIDTVTSARPLASVMANPADMFLNMKSIRSFATGFPDSVNVAPRVAVSGP